MGYAGARLSRPWSGGRGGNRRPGGAVSATLDDVRSPELDPGIPPCPTLSWNYAERLRSYLAPESELEIARELQNQLFPKDVPFTKTLEMKGVCHPARMVSGDYYDFMALRATARAM
ncbi:MAG TPA: hypothetical protein VGZ73_02310 [Bryobacteraceae bacterium]|nr:hypothetical protein [Bryobacteraceae bacterium]